MSHAAAHRDDPVAPASQGQQLLEENLGRPADGRKEDNRTPDVLRTGIIQRPHLTVVIIDYNLEETGTPQLYCNLVEADVLFKGFKKFTVVELRDRKTNEELLK